jgi:ribosomal-protein-alanine N-acetyltransferase
MMPPEWRPPILTTPRLTLRPFHDGDAEPLFEHARNPNVTRFTLWDHHKTVAESLAFVRDYALLRYREGTPEPYAVTLISDSRPIGSCGVFWASQPNRTMELGYWLAEPCWGKGIAVEASRAVIGMAFRDYEPERIQARVIVGNTASSRVLEKLGFHHEGILRSSLYRRGKYEDLLFYSLLRTEWDDGPGGEAPEPG